MFLRCLFLYIFLLILEFSKGYFTRIQLSMIMEKEGFLSQKPKIIIKNHENNRRAIEIGQGFSPRQYDPPLWAKNCHLNTILGGGELQKKFLGATSHRVPEYVRRSWRTPCGNDFINVDFLDAPFATDRMAVLLHGLESSSKAPLTSKIALTFQSAGFDVAVVNFRGCGGDENLTPGGYHFGFTSDLDFILKELKREADGSSRFFYLSGFSLGGNVITKYLGELGDSASDLGIMGASVACVPFDGISCQKKLDTGFFGRQVYSKVMLASLIQKARRQAKQFPEAYPDTTSLETITSIREFDDAITANIYGYRDSEDYYQQNSSKQFLKDIKVPYFCINALDDPFVECSTLPIQEEFVDAPLVLYYTKYGGHCGFTHENYENNLERCWLADELVNFATFVDDKWKS